MKIKRLENNNGFAASDALIAVLIITLSTGIIASLIYNIYLSNASLKRMSKANGYIVDVFEYIDKIYYDDVNNKNLIEYFNNKYYYETDGVTPKQNADVMAGDNITTLNTSFKVIINVQNYNEIEGNEDKLDLVKQITMSVTYKLGGKDQTIEIKRIKSREKLKTPNTPDFNLLELQEGYNVYPIKKIDNIWKVCDKSDSSWYDYPSGKWALVIKTSKTLSLNEEIDINNLLENEEIIAWIPRYAYDSANNKIQFLFSNSNNYIEEIDGYNNLISIDGSSYIVSDSFLNGEEELVGIWTKDSSIDVYTTLNNIYPLKQ